MPANTCAPSFPDMSRMSWLGSGLFDVAIEPPAPAAYQRVLGHSSDKFIEAFASLAIELVK